MAEPRAYASASAFRRALEDRLLLRSKAEGVDVQRLRRLVAFERLLARLVAGQGVSLVLKGGFAMELRFRAARATRDIDLILRDRLVQGRDPSVASVLEKIQEDSAQDLGDFFVFRVGEAVMDLEAVPYGGARYPALARMDGREFTTFHVDVAFGDEVLDPLDHLHGRDWLSFAGLRSPAIPALSPEQHFSEKLHAYTLPREATTNSRVKDLVDLVLLIQSGLMQPARLRAALEFTFRRRATHAMPDRLMAPPADWSKPFAALARECALDYQDVSIAFGLVNRFYEALTGS